MSEEVQHVRITNRNTFSIVDRYDGVAYAFPPGEAVTAPLDAVRHIFGFHLASTEDEVMTHCMKRFGWNRPELVRDEMHKTYFDNIEIKPVRYRMVEVEPTPLPPIDLTQKRPTPSKRWSREEKQEEAPASD